MGIQKMNLNGTKSDVLSHAMDWVATFIEGIAGDELPKDKQFDSMNLLDGIQDKNKWNRTTLYVDIEVEGGLYVIINDTLSGHVWKLINDSHLDYFDWYLCNGTVENGKSEQLYLFDIANDPYERNNLYSKY